MKKIEININEQHSTIKSALEKRGFTYISKEECFCEDIGWLEEYIGIFKKDDKYYGLLRYDNYNRFIYDAELLEVEELKELEEEALGNKLQEHRDCLIGYQVTLREFDDICSRQIGDDNETIFNYNADDIISNYEEGKSCVGFESSFAYLNTFNVVFKVIEDADEFKDVVVEITDVETV